MLPVELARILETRTTAQWTAILEKALAKNTVLLQKAVLQLKEAK